MQPPVVFAVVGLLEQDIRADARVGQPAVVFDRRGGDVYVHATDGAVAVADAVDRADALQDVVDRVERMLARLERQSFVPHILQGDDFVLDLLLRELPSQHRAVGSVVGTVGTPVDAEIREIEGREQHDAVAVDALLDAPRQRINSLVERFVGTFEQQGRLAMGQPAGRFGLVENRTDQGALVPVFPGVSHRPFDFVVVDELRGPFR